MRVLGVWTWAAAVGVAAGTGWAARGQEGVATSASAGAKADEAIVIKGVEVDVAREPVPALRYRFLPSAAELNPGDAAPIYLRIRHEMRDEAWDEIGRKTGDGGDGGGTNWLEVPIAELPVKEARAFVDGWKVRLKQIEYGTHREECDWSYTLPEQRLESIMILLPDVQSMRNWGRLLALKARVEIAEGRFEEAIGTIETGMAFGRHVGSGPFLINRLVGIALCSIMLDRVEELIAQPGAPSVYWALTVLPTPMLDLRTSLELEQRIAEFMVPELVEARSEHSAGEWTALLDRMLDRLRRLTQELAGFRNEEPALLKKLEESWKRATMKATLLPEARKRLADRGIAADQVAAMSDDEAIARFIAMTYLEVRDAVFKWGYVPYASTLGEAESNRVEAQLKELKAGALGVFAEIVPAVRSGLRASVRLDRRIAALRVVEALRMYAASHDGKLPASFEEVTGVPVPEDPATGKPFAFQVEGDSVVIRGSRLDGVEKTEVGYKVSIRR